MTSVANRNGHFWIFLFSELSAALGFVEPLPRFLLLLFVPSGLFWGLILPYLAITVEVPPYLVLGPLLVLHFSP